MFTACFVGVCSTPYIPSTIATPTPTATTASRGPIPGWARWVVGPAAAGGSGMVIGVPPSLLDHDDGVALDRWGVRRKRPGRTDVPTAVAQAGHAAVRLLDPPARRAGRGGAI